MGSSPGIAGFIYVVPGMLFGLLKALVFHEDGDDSNTLKKVSPLL